MAKYRNVTVKIPEEHASKIEQVDGRDLETIINDVVAGWFEDHRRRDIPVKRQGISWSKPLYEAMLKHVGQGGVSSYIREAVYEDLSKNHKGLIAVPDWKDGRDKIKMKGVRKAASDRLACQAPIIFPAQWIELLEEMYPKKVSTYIKAVVQMKLEKQFKISVPVQKGLGMFLNR